MTHRGQIKCIFIDPPYNTGNKDFVYNDRYISEDDRFRQSMWLEFLYRRMDLARDLISSDGIILVCINDENRSKLELMMDEVFPAKRVGSLAWRTKDTANDDNRNFSQVHEHILVYANSGFRFGGEFLDLSKYKNRDNDPRGEWSPDPLTKAHTYVERPNTYYPINDPRTGYWYPCSPDRVCAYATKSRIKVGQKLRAKPIEDYLDDNRIAFPVESNVFIYQNMDELHSAIESGAVPRDGNGNPLLRLGLPDLEFWIGKKIGAGRPAKKSFLKEKKNLNKPISSWIAGFGETVNDQHIETLRSNRQGEGTDALKQILGSKIFNFPKPPSLIKSVLKYILSDGDIALDFFAGSGTTAQAVIDLNAEDGGHRRFIMVSSTEATEDNLDRNLCRDVCAERIRRVIAASPIGGEFGYLKAGKIDFHQVAYRLSSDQVWTAVQAMHGLSIKPYDNSTPLQIAEGETSIVYCDKVTDELSEDLARREGPMIVYSWAPGQLRNALSVSHIELRSIPQFLLQRFQA
jgi:adenine-specific DNA-methyltransferase